MLYAAIAIGYLGLSCICGALLARENNKAPASLRLRRCELALVSALWPLILALVLADVVTGVIRSRLRR